MNRLKSTIPPSILSGWKDIAKHLRKSVRTVQRYELELGLPIRRLAGKSRSSVVATAAELDAWVNASPLRQSFALCRKLPDSVAALDGFKAVLAEHHRLRQQMVRFREELHTARELFLENLGVIRARDIGESTHRSGVLMPFESGKRRLN